MDQDDEKTVNQTVPEADERGGETPESQPTAAEPVVTEETEVAESAGATSAENTAEDKTEAAV